MQASHPPSMDPVAAQAWHRRAPATSPWLHEEIGRRMADRLQWIRNIPQVWCNWGAVRGGVETHALVREQYAKAQCFLVEDAPVRLPAAQALAGGGKWWQPQQWGRAKQSVVSVPPAGGVQMLWANMALHMAADPQALLQAWHDALAVQGFVMFSCLGPDTLQELRALYAEAGWPAPHHEFTDMHDWGDMLVQTGFAEPVMDMERITLTFASPQRLRAELRELGVNLHAVRFQGLRGRGWLRAFDAALARRLERDGTLSLTFEVIYGHAIKPEPRVAVASHSEISLDAMRSMLRKERKPQE